MERIPIISHKSGITKYAGLALTQRLIPFFGAGFTRGCRSFGGVALDRNESTREMKKLILQMPGDLKDSDVKCWDFNQTADYFFHYAAKNTQSKFLKDYFTDVLVEDERKDFLQHVDWPHAYTLNIDDGIERTFCFHAVTPFRISRQKPAARKLYKLHGDAPTEVFCRHEQKENIIFSTGQYRKFIQSGLNRPIPDKLARDYMSRNILFVGCSLRNETDLELIYRKVENRSAHNFRAVLLDREPAVPEESHFRTCGVNEIILADDYKQFYLDFIHAYNELDRKQKETGSFFFSAMPRCLSQSPAIA